MLWGFSPNQRGVIAPGGKAMLRIRESWFSIWDSQLLSWSRLTLVDWQMTLSDIDGIVSGHKRRSNFSHLMWAFVERHTPQPLRVPPHDVSSCAVSSRWLQPSLPFFLQSTVTGLLRMKRYNQCRHQHSTPHHKMLYRTKKMAVFGCYIGCKFALV